MNGASVSGRRQALRNHREAWRSVNGQTFELALDEVRCGMTSESFSLATAIAERLSVIAPFPVEGRSGVVGIVWPGAGYLGGTDLRDGKRIGA